MNLKKVLASLIVMAMLVSSMGLVALASNPELPTATVTDLDAKALGLTFALNFTADDVTEEQLTAYGAWFADFELTVNKDVTFNAASEKSDGYLSGQYDVWSENWVNVPFEDKVVYADQPLKIMATAAEMMGEPGLKYTYAEVYDVVKNFNCGVKFTDAFLAANPDLEVTLELKMYNNLDETESYVIGSTYSFTAADAAVAEVDGVPYPSLETALKALNTVASSDVSLLAISGAKTLTLLRDVTISENWEAKKTGGKITVPANINGNGHTIFVNSTVNDNNHDAFFRFENDASIEKLTIDMSGVTGDNWFRAISAAGVNLTISDSTFIGNGTTANARAIIVAEGGNAAETNLIVENSNFENWKIALTTGENGKDAQSITVTGSTFENVGKSELSATDNVTFTDNKMENSWVGINNYTGDNNLVVNVTGNKFEENNTASNRQTNTIGKANGEAFEKATVNAQPQIAVSGRNPVELEVKFVEASKGVYDIVVSGNENINQLSTAKLTFVNTSKNNDNTDMGYSISGVAPYNYLVEGDTYTFYAVQGATLSKDKKEVTIGQVTFSGYGDIDFTVDTAANNNVIVKTLNDNAEFIYIANGGQNKNNGKLILDTDAIIDDEVQPVMAELTIVVDYVHTIARVNKDYQNMKIEITGLDLLDGPIEIKLGNDQADYYYTFANCGDYTSESNVAHKKTSVKVKDQLIKGNSYTVKISGDGYRTAEYTIRMDVNKTLTFWNNVMTSVTKMEKDDATGTQVNFLAGDILPDEIINVYDLSAVVSYFGENPKANAGYIQYDLNRDGKIDGLDISILLNSWGK